MTKRLTSLLILTLFTVAILTAVSGASTRNDARIAAARHYSFQQHLQQTGPDQTGKNQSTQALGAYSADGGSPGYITGRTFHDQQNWHHVGNTIGWKHSPRLHFALGSQMVGGADELAAARWTEYTMFDPTTAPGGVWQTPVWLHTDPFNWNGTDQQLAIDETGHAVVISMSHNPSNADIPYDDETFWDVAGPGAFGTFISDTLPQSISLNEVAHIAYPRIAYQEFNGTYITHVTAYETVVPAGWVTYYRRVGANPTIGNWTMTPISSDVSWDVIHTVVCSRGDGPEGNKVAIVWLSNENEPGNADDADDNVVYIESTDGGATWPTLETPTRIINIVSEPGVTDWVAWAEVDALYDSEGYLHIAYNSEASEDASAPTIDPSRVYHWTNRVAGDNGGGTLSLVHVADYHGLNPMCGRAGGNRLNASNVAVSECNGRLYMTWQQFGDPDEGDSLDCPVDNEWMGGYNGEIYMSVSLSLDGSLWDAGRNLTNSKTPDCDTTVANNCDADNYPSPSRIGMNVAAMGDTYWGAVPEAFQVRDYLDAAYPDDGWYLDIHYIDDLYPEAAPWMDEPVWSYSPMKWFRLPCVDPIIEPNILCAQPDFLAPTDWVKAGEPFVIEDVAIENIGNDVLTVNSVTATVTTGLSSWISIAGVPATVAAGGVEYFDVTLNPGGIVTSQEQLAAEIYIDSDDPDDSNILAFTINTLIADTVVQVIWDTVYNSGGQRLIVGNQGSAGNSGSGLVNMDFVYIDSTGPDCDSTQNVYMYDLCPIVMYDGTGDPGTYSWGPFWTPDRSAAYNFMPVADGVEATRCEGDGFVQYRTNTFVTSDSTLGCTKHWVSPAADESWVIEKWEVYSYNGGSVTGARLGEWIDWDIPSGTPGNHGGFVADAGSVDYLYQQGVIEPTDTPCLSEDLRFGGSGLLGYYTSTEKEADAGINHTGLYGGFVHLDDDLFVTGTDQFIVDSVWAWLNRNTLALNNSADDDQQVLLSYGSFDIVPNDTVVIWTVHATVYNGDSDSLQALIDAAEAWYLANRDKVGTCFSGCCGIYTDGDKWPLNYSGNANCSDDGKRTLSDISRMIDFLYISKQPLCCYAAGNTNGSLDYNEQTGEYDCKITLSDVSKLIDALYISKQIAAECQSVCER